jgi:hypothetical protein
MTKREKILVIWMVVMTWGHIIWNRFLIDSNKLFMHDMFRALRNLTNSFT